MSEPLWPCESCGEPSLLAECDACHGKRTAPPPLVVRIGASTWAWIERGVLWLTSGGPWALVADYQPAPGIGGRVLTESEVAALVQRVGRPV